MAEYFFKNKLIENYVSEFQSRIVSETGIESDKYHLGKIILQSFKNDPDFVTQIDGGTGESETNSSMLRRSIQCANSLKNMGLKTGDAIVLMAPNHVDLAVPLYAALYLGLASAAIDITLGVNELRETFNNIKPKAIFCQSEKVQDVRKAVDFSGLDSKIISFDKSPDTTSFSEMMKKHGDEVDVENFKPADFDPDETIAYLISTSGTTGLPKSAVLTHKNMMTTGPSMCKMTMGSCWNDEFIKIADLGPWTNGLTCFPRHGAIIPPTHKLQAATEKFLIARPNSFTSKLPPIQSVLLLSPLQWLTAILNYLMSPFYKYTRIQSSHPLTTEHTIELIGKYRPTFMIVSPTMMATLLKAVKQVNCDISCYEIIYLGGSAVPKTLVEEIKRLTPNTVVTDVYGMTEAGSVIFHSPDSPLGSFGKPFAHMQYKLVNVETGEEIKEPNKRGELWIKTPGGFKGYYKNSEATSEVLSKDEWIMTGDMMYRDENWNFYFVERIKLLLKYKNHQISPVELEAVIHQHPAVLDVAVTSLSDPECGDLPVACVIKRSGADVTAEEIQDLVKEKLADTKQLRGGVIFLEELPLTTSSKLHRRKLKDIVVARTREQAAI